MKDNETLEQHLSNLINEEREAFERARKHQDSDNVYAREQCAREMFEAQYCLLKELARELTDPGKEPSDTPFLYEPLLRIAKMLEALSVGKRVQAIEDVTVAGGRPERYPDERRDVAVALRYIEHARAREISDHAFIASVSKAFQVDRTTVRDWLKNRDSILEGLPELTASMCRAKLAQAGARYHFNRTGERTEGVN